MLKIAERTLIIVFFALAFLALIAPYMAKAQDIVPDYADALVGGSAWLDWENNQQIEADSDVGIAGQVAIGWDLDFVAADISAGCWNHKLHGTNPPGGNEHNSADGKRGTFCAIMPGAWLQHDFEGPLTLYAGGGAGGGGARIFGETDLTYAYQVGAGLVYEFTEDWSAHLAYRYVRFGETEHDGLDAQFDTHTALLGVRYEF